MVDLSSYDSSRQPATLSIETRGTRASRSLITFTYVYFQPRTSRRRRLPPSSATRAKAPEYPSPQSPRCPCNALPRRTSPNRRRRRRRTTPGWALAPTPTLSPTDLATGAIHRSRIPVPTILPGKAVRTATALVTARATTKTVRVLQLNFIFLCTPSSIPPGLCTNWNVQFELQSQSNMSKKRRKVLSLVEPTNMAMFYLSEKCPKTYITPVL